ncbi:chagasin family peptidase inhibitor I42 [Archangium gephyra]|uniref:Chagasin family peptidase inhibitor I42 n=1 Tax=Archangium gephyra TaxID=48 RepID=A0AAC8QBR7_9BACT|nr:protease inhibitor I42 family protein [Archangium gephyra]AKJ04571.1 Twin-arginine translocation protein TatB [Archangium gephyra]REG37365.1 chagasin family peptidase inhibitor I42 [Archangium gephyra]
MAKPRSGAKKATPAAKKVKSTKPGVLKTASKSVAKAAAKLVTKAAGNAKQQEKKAPAEKKAAPAAAAKKTAAKAATKVKEVAVKAAAKVKEVVAPKGKEKEPVPKAKEKDKEAAPPPKGKEKESAPKGKGREAAAAPPAVEKPRPRATKLPPMAEPLNKRDLEQLLTAGAGRGVVGEGSLKGRLTVIDGLPNLVVVGRDKRELTFILQGPDQEVLPAYLDHKVSVSGLIKKTTNYGGTVDVRKFSAKKPEVEEPTPEPVETEIRLRYLSPGEVSQVISAGMGAGMKGFAALRGNLEMTGDEFVLVVSNGGTRQQVSYILEGKGAKGLRKYLGHTLSVTGVVDKSSGWGGRIDVENVEPRPSDIRPISREGLDSVHVEGEQSTTIEVKLNHAFTVRLPEQAGFTWAIEPTAAKRVGLREANFEPGSEGTATREFFFTPRNPGTSDVEFFLAKAFNPGQVERSFKLTVTVKP